MKKGVKQAGVKGVLVCFVLLAVCVVGLAILAKSMANDGRVLTYKDCTEQKGNRLQGSYPEVCVTKDGKTFVNPAQQVSCGRISWSTNPSVCQ